MFDIHLNDGSEIPKSPIVFIVGKTGIFLRKKLGLVESTVKVDGISTLQDIEEEASMFFKKKIPSSQVNQIVKFFKDVYSIYQGEAAMVLHYREKKGGQYFIQVVPQQVSGGSVEYVNEPLDGWLRVGTIHSHGSMSAFHSAVDDRDEYDFDGLHITFGSITSERISISASIVVNKKRFAVSPLDYMDGIEYVEKEEIETEQKYSPFSLPFVKYIWNGFDFSKKDINKEPIIKAGYELKDNIEKITYPNNWLKNVSKRQPIQIEIEMFKNRQDGLNGPSLKDLISKSSNRVDEDWDPCEKCPYREFKSDAIFNDMVQQLDDEQLDALGFTEDKEDTNE